MPTRNKALFNKIADIIEMKPEMYDQNQWGKFTDDIIGDEYIRYGGQRIHCGTAHCIAGWAASICGIIEKIPATAVYDNSWDGDFETRSGRERNVSEWAAEELGLEESEADFLFNMFWKPAAGYTVPQALRMIGAGAAMDEVGYLS